MCVNCTDRSLRLKRLALDFRALAQKPGLDALLPNQLVASAAELEALAESECHASRLAADDVVWVDASKGNEDEASAAPASSASSAA